MRQKGLDMAIITEIRDYFDEQEYDVRLIKIKAGYVIAYVDDEILSGTIIPGDYMLRLESNHSSHQIPLTI